MPTPGDHHALLGLPRTAPGTRSTTPSDGSRGGTIPDLDPGNREAETQNGARLRLRGLGLPDSRGGGPGHLYAEARVYLPLALDERTRRRVEGLPTWPAARIGRHPAAAREPRRERMVRDLPAGL